jgi:cysteine desulfurase/selenocysteine lyase
MMPRRIYLDNSATSFPKPEAVHEAMIHYARDIGASAGRGAYREAMQSAEILTRCRSLLARLLNATKPESFFFTLNATDALNLAIKGLLRPGDHAITTWMDHNSVLRPLNALRDRAGVTTTFVECDPQTGLVNPDDIRRAILPTTRLIAVVHASNVTGTVQPIAEIGRIARERDIPFLVDAAQSVGHLPIDVQTIPIDAMAFPGHKALLGPLGTGVLYVRPGLERALDTLREGGTGSASEQAHQPDFLPDRYEPGSHNAIGIAGLVAGIGYLLDRGLDDLRHHEEALSAKFMAEVGEMNHVTLYGPRRMADRVGVFSIRVDGYEPIELSAALEARFGILTRSGLHCAPLAHRTISTYDRGGTTRLSFGPFVTTDDVALAIHAVAELARSNLDAVAVRP